MKVYSLNPAAPGQASDDQEAFAASNRAVYIDPQNSSGNASDSNAGTAGAPWSTYGRYRRTIGPALIAPGAQHVVNLMSDTTAADPVIPPNVGAGASFTMRAYSPSITALLTGTLTGAVPVDPATNTPYEIEDTNVVNWTPYIQRRLRDEASGVFGWITADETGGVARTSIPEIDYQTGDDYSVLQVPVVAVVSFDGVVVAPTGTITFRSLDFAVGCVVPALGSMNASNQYAVSFVGCHLGGADPTTNPVMQGSFVADNCLLCDPTFDAGAAPNLTRCVFVASTFGYAFCYLASIILGDACVTQGLAFSLFGCPLLEIGSLGIFDPPDNGITMDAGSSAEVLTALYGNAGANAGVRLYSGGNSLTYQATPTLTGAHEFTIAGANHAWSDGAVTNGGAFCGPSV